MKIWYYTFDGHLVNNSNLWWNYPLLVLLVAMNISTTDISYRSVGVADPQYFALIAVIYR